MPAAGRANPRSRLPAPGSRLSALGSPLPTSGMISNQCGQRPQAHAVLGRNRLVASDPPDTHWGAGARAESRPLEASPIIRPAAEPRLAPPSSQWTLSIA